MFIEADPAATRGHVIQAVMDVRQVMDLAESRKELETSKGIFVVGYSMGGWIAALTGGADRRASAMVLMVPVSEAAPVDTEAGRSPVTRANAGQARTSRAGAGKKPTAEAKVDSSRVRGQKLLLDRYLDLRPTGAIARFSPRPVLIQAGTMDVYLPREPVEGLFAAAGRPKELRWYPAGHILPEKAMEETADWLVARYKAGQGQMKGGEGQRGKAGEKRVPRPASQSRSPGA